MICCATRAAVLEPLITAPRHESTTHPTFINMADVSHLGHQPHRVKWKISPVRIPDFFSSLFIFAVQADVVAYIQSVVIVDRVPLVAK